MALDDVAKNYPDVKWLRGCKENKDMQGVHIVNPDEVEIMTAAERAEQHGFGAVYIHIE